MIQDNYSDALGVLYSLTNKLFGGHYEPKSKRDQELAEDLYEVLNRHKNQMQNEKIDLDYIRAMFPKNPSTVSVTSYIPIAFFEAHEKEIREICRTEKLRIVHRGPREGNAASTLRKNANAVVLYYR